jgi:NAD(P)-dependent dehydrogenase (short-subunit alcohol dehydrogenase family)
MIDTDVIMGHIVADDARGDMAAACRLTDKIILVTARRGIGRAIVERCLADQALVTLIDRDADAAAARLTSCGAGAVVHHSADVTRGRRERRGRRARAARPHRRPHQQCRRQCLLRCPR